MYVRQSVIDNTDNDLHPHRYYDNVSTDECAVDIICVTGLTKESRKERQKERKKKQIEQSKIKILQGKRKKERKKE